MRLWSIHPKYLDTKGLVALWREGLLAQAVLENKTKGYRHHPQLERFRECSRSLNALRSYLHVVCDVAEEREYRFARVKIGRCTKVQKSISVTSGQIKYEWLHLLRKLRTRDRKLYLKVKSLKRPELHPLFRKKPGAIASWEIVKK